MAPGNSTNYLNGSSFRYDKNPVSGISFPQTLLLTPFVVIFVILFSILAYQMVKKRAFSKSKRQHHLVPLYHFDPGECDNWEDEILEDSLKPSSKLEHQFYSSIRVLQQ